MVLGQGMPGKFFPSPDTLKFRPYFRFSLRRVQHGLAGATFWWVVPEVLQVSVIPFTLIVILPTNKQLLNPALDRRSAQTGRLLARWGTLHAVRSVLSALALLLLLYRLIFRDTGDGGSTGNDRNRGS
jgi:hypothetical protein